MKVKKIWSAIDGGGGESAFEIYCHYFLFSLLRGRVQQQWSSYIRTEQGHHLKNEYRNN